MGYTRTQIYLDPEDHRRLSEEARKRGKPLTALLREIVGAYLRRGPGGQSPRSFDGIIGLAGEGPASDIATEEQQALREARQARLRKKLGA